jgi:hypothetical protein
MRADGWFGSLVVGGGEVSCGSGGVGVLMMLRLVGTCEDGGGVIDEVVGGAGDVNLTLSGLLRLDCPGEPGLEGEARLVGVAGRESSVEAMSESWESWDKDAWESILPGRRWPKPRATRQKCVAS